MKPPRALPRRLLIAGAALASAGALALAMRLQISQPQIIVTGKADVGGTFRLTDPDGRTITDRDFRGRTLVVYFGWTSDPDLTPAALQVLTAAVEKIGRKSERLARVFISLDPERDTREKMRVFAGKIDHRLVALSGNSDEIAVLAKAFKLYFKRLPDDSLPGGYSIDHASLYYVFGVDGEFRGIVPHTTDVTGLATELSRFMD